MKKKVLLFGTFDFLHIGHMHLLKQAKALGDVLIVAIARDEIITKLKGKPPIHSEKERKDLVSHIDVVDEVFLGDREMSSYNVLKKIQPDVIALGYDQTDLKKDLQKYIEKTRNAIKLVTLKPYKPNERKSSHIKKALLL